MLTSSLELDAVVKQSRYNSELRNIVFDLQNEVHEATSQNADPWVIEDKQNSLHRGIIGHYTGYFCSLQDVFNEKELARHFGSMASCNFRDLAALAQSDSGQRNALQQEIQSVLLAQQHKSALTELVKVELGKVGVAVKEVVAKCKDTECVGALGGLFAALRPVVDSVKDTVHFIEDSNFWCTDLEANVEESARRVQDSERLAATLLLEGDVDGSLRVHGEVVWCCHKACRDLADIADRYEQKFRLLESMSTSILQQLESVLNASSRTKHRWRQLRKACTKDLVVYQAALVEEDHHDRNAESEFKSDLLTLQQKIKDVQAEQRRLRDGTEHEYLKNDLLAKAKLLNQEHGQYIKEWVLRVEGHRGRQARYAALIEIIQERCMFLRLGQEQCSTLITCTGCLEGSVRALIMLLKRSVYDILRCEVHEAMWEVRQDLLEMSRKLYISSGILMYKHHARAQVDPNSSSTSRASALQEVVNLQRYVEDSSALYSRVVANFEEAGVAVPPPPTALLEAMLEVRKSEVMKHLQNATSSACPLLQSFVIST
eukprot:PhF_6_TR2339/c0_g1_i1/m.4181